MTAEMKLRTLTGIFLILMTAGCAEVPMVMELHPEDNIKFQDMVWPSPPDVPRYRYAGQLIGEQNLTPDGDVQQSTGTQLLRWLVGLGDVWRQPKVLQRPQNGMVCKQGRIFVTDVGNSAVYVFDGVQGKLEVWDRADANAHFEYPIAIAESGENEILVTDSKLARVVRLDLEGNPLGSFGDGVLERPTGLTVDSVSGLIYVADTKAHNIKVFDNTGALRETIGSRGTGEGQFNAPTHLAFAKGRLYVSDTLNARVQILDTDGEFLSSIGQRGLYVGNLIRPKGVTVDDNGNIYIVESYFDHLLVFNEQGELLLPMGGTGSGVGGFFLPSGVFSDSQNRIFTADMFNSRVIIMQYLGTE